MKFKTYTITVIMLLLALNAQAYTGKPKKILSTSDSLWLAINTITNKLDSILSTKNLKCESRIKDMQDSLNMERKASQEMQKKLNESIAKQNDLTLLKSKVQTLEQKNRDKKSLDSMALEKEISSVFSQGINFPEALLKSLQIRAQTLNPSNRTMLEKFIQVHAKLNEAQSILTKAIDVEKTSNLLNEVKNISIDKSFMGLLDFKPKVINRLILYCDKNNILSKYIADSKGYSDLTQRKDFLDSTKYEFSDFPYLKEVLEAAMQNKAVNIQTNNCK